MVLRIQEHHQSIAGKSETALCTPPQRQKIDLDEILTVQDCADKVGINEDTDED